jgi:formylglycine-generating enzyme required for sulfatase activity
MMDGSAKFFVDEVDLSVWHAVHSRETREVTVPASFESPVVDEKMPPSPEPAHPFPGNVEPITNSIGMKLVRIRAGEFIMGLPDAGYERETPLLNVRPNVCPHRVRITRNFDLSAFEVTQGQFARIMGTASQKDSSQDGRDATVDQDRLQFPVTNVSWVDAVTFCGRLSALPTEKAAGRRYRLPTEAEWEYACRAGSMQPFSAPEGEEADAMGFNQRPTSSTGLLVAKVGSYPPNPFGLYDMRGNVMEWCADWFAWDYYKHSPEDDPLGPSSGVLRVVRGADWRFSGTPCHFTRFDTEPWRTSPFIGFRVVCEMTPE